MEGSRGERSLGDLLGSLSSQVGTLVHKEVELARTEMTANALRIGRSGALIGVGGAIVYGAFLALVIAAIALLATLGLPVWVSALVVSVVLAVVGYVLIGQGRERLQTSSLAPKRTLDTLRDDATWAKDETR